MIQLLSNHWIKAEVESHLSPCWISCLFLPSNDTQAVLRASGDSVICKARAVNTSLLMQTSEPLNFHKLNHTVPFPRRFVCQTTLKLQLFSQPTLRSHHELHSGRNHDGSKGERVGADGGDHDGRDVGVDHGSSRCGSVGRAACGGGNYYTCTETHSRFAFIFMTDGTLFKTKTTQFFLSLA